MDTSGFISESRRQALFIFIFIQYNAAAVLESLSGLLLSVAHQRICTKCNVFSFLLVYGNPSGGEFSYSYSLTFPCFSHVIADI